MTGTTEFPSHIRKSIRDTQRMLARPNLLATVRQQQERKLHALQLAVEGKAVLEKQQKIASKYRMIRFFESKKAARHLCQALKSKDEAAIRKAVKDALYVKFFPNDQKYISLFPSAPCVDEEVLAKRSNMRESIFEAHGAEYESQVSIQLLAAKPASKAKSSGDDDDDEEEEEDSDEGSDIDSDESDGDDDDGEDSFDEDDDSDDDIDGDDEFDDSDDDSFEDEDDDDDEDEDDDEDDDDDDEDDDDDSDDWSSDEEDDSHEEKDADEDSEKEEEHNSDAGSSRKKSRV